MLEQNAARHVGVRGVELLDERRRQLRRLVVRVAAHQEILAPDQLALPDEEHLRPAVAPLLRQRDHVRVFVGQMQDLLPFVHLLDCRHLVAERGGALEFQALRRRFHPRADAPHDLIDAPFQKHRHLFDYLVVAFLIDRAHARGGAAVNEVVETSPVVLPRYRLGAGTIGEQLFENRERLADAVRAGERAEVARAVVLHAPR